MVHLLLRYKKKVDLWNVIFQLMISKSIIRIKRKKKEIIEIKRKKKEIIQG